MAVDLESEVLEHVEREVVAAIRFEAQHYEITPSSRVLGIGSAIQMFCKAVLAFD
jgi:hypothetical protein